MALLDILVYPDPRLRQKAEPVSRVDVSIQKLVDDMAETMYQAPGIGLAAVQVNVAKRVIVIDISTERNDLKVLINPEIQERAGAQESEEGCLSVPGVFAPVNRAEQITVSAIDRQGKPYQFQAEGLLAVCIQHEIDHLDGKVFVDYLSRIKQDRIRKRLKKQSRQSNEIAPAQAVL
ncbi:MAG TPA: peptide deformylase [Paracoccaceae bacterium]|nr:peptide deformylase [Paracoccaceae bacterium]